jgi:exonuclease III
MIIPLITLNISGLNSPIKGNKLKDWLCKQDPTFCCIQESHLRNKDRYYLRDTDWKIIFRTSESKYQAGVAILILNKMIFYLTLSKKIRMDTSYSPKVKFIKMNTQF